MYPGEASHTSVATSEGRAGSAGDMVNGHAIWDDISVSYILYVYGKHMVDIYEVSEVSEGSEVSEVAQSTAATLGVVYV